MSRSVVDVTVGGGVVVAGCVVTEVVVTVVVVTVVAGDVTTGGVVVIAGDGTTGVVVGVVVVVTAGDATRTLISTRLFDGSGSSSGLSTVTALANSSLAAESTAISNGNVAVASRSSPPTDVHTTPAVVSHVQPATASRRPNPLTG